MRGRGKAVQCLLLATLAGCGKDGYQLTGPTTVATGVSFTIKVGDACPKSHRSKDLSLCWDDPVTAIDSATAGPPFVIDRQELSGINALFTLHAGAEGSTDLALLLRDGNGGALTFNTALDAHDIDEVRVGPRCSGGIREPLRIYRGRSLMFDFEPRGDGLKLFTGGLVPFVSTAGTPTLHQEGVGIVDLSMLAAGEMGTLTSPAVPSFRLTYQIVDMSVFDRVVLEPGMYSPARPVPIGSTMDYVVKLYAGGDQICAAPDFADATATVETPMTCRFWSTKDPYFDERVTASVSLQAEAVGTCRVRVDIQNTALRGYAEFMVVPPQGG